MSTPQWALDRIQKAKKEKSTTLSLSSLQTGYSLAEIPDAIYELSDLTSLDLSHNQLTNLPEAITRLQNLKWLDLMHNRLTSFPESITSLQNLNSLYLNQNQLTSLPESIGKLQELIILNLNQNQLTSLPESIVTLENLRSLNLIGNYLARPPQEVAQEGIKAIRAYFRQLEEQGQEQLYEAKLLILGEGGAGKTTLARKLENSNYELQDETSTLGVDVTTWAFFMVSGKPFRVNIWDFGGQEIYHATHQFFLTKRSLYALVADTRKEDTDFYYWLNLVELLSENSPLLIIKNEKQDRHRELNERQLRGQFENLKEVLAVNLATNHGLDKIKAEMEHYLKNLPHIGSTLPKTWVRVRQRLENDSRNYITLDEYLAICSENGFTEMKDSLQLSQYLNDIGVCLHFQDEPLLNKTVILKPKWGTDAVYKVLDNPMVIKSLGRFTRADLNMIWSASEYEVMRDELVQLMMKFKLCYEIPAQKGAYIAPQLLTENQPDYKWVEEENLLLRYTYEFMPKGILQQFIVVMSENILKQNVWKSGVLLEKDKTHAEVIEFYSKREIKVRVAGAHQKALMTIVLNELDKIHATYKRLKVDKLIQCNCERCKTKQEPYFYRFETLQKFIEDRQEQIQCQQSYKMVRILSLVDDAIGWKPDKEVEELMAKQKSQQMQQPNIIVGSVNISGNAKVDGFNLGGTIQESFNKAESADISGELKETLKQLAEAVTTMSKDLPVEQTIEVIDDFEKLVDEATKPAPNKKWYSVSIEGLTQAAQNLGQVGEPVVKLAAKVLGLLMAG